MFTAPRRDLREYLAQVPDPRGRKGRRHVFTAILTAVVCSILQNCRGYRPMGEWLHEQPVDFWHFLGFRRKPPTASGLRKVLSRIDVVAFEQALTNWIQDSLADQAASADLPPMSLDGKSLRGTWDRFDGAVHLLAVVDQRTRCVLHQRCVPAETNEHKVALDVLKDLVLTGRVVTGDAAFCHRDVCEVIVDGGGHYVLPVKDNQPQLLAAISSEFAAEEAAFSPYAQRERAAERDTVSTLDKGHGRLERRTLTTTTGLNHFLQQQLGWSSVRQVFRVSRERAWTDRVTGERRTSREVAYGITDLSPTQANAAKLLELNRGHWTIENSVFYVRDEAFGEDRSRIRTRAGPEVLAAFRNAALNLLRLTGSTNISASLRKCTWNLQHVLNLLGILK